MTAAALLSLLTQVLANLPEYITTGRQLMHFINEVYERLHNATVGKDVSEAEIKELIAKIVKNSHEIQSIP